MQMRHLRWHGDSESTYFWDFDRFPDNLQTSSVIQIFILAMVLYPDVQARARSEIDQVVPHDRIPSIDDRTSLPYIDAVLCEVLRWNTPAPLGLSAVIWFRVCIADPLSQGLRMQHHKMMSTKGISYLKVRGRMS